MFSYKLLIDDERYPLSSELKSKLEETAWAAFEAEGLSLPAAAGLMLCGDREIHAINLEQRGIDRPTDVLSFPTVSYLQGKTANASKERLQREWADEYKACYLGDIVISVDTALRQAKEYEHSFEREICYLLVHGLCHLMGYDHMNGKDKAKMRAKEEQAMERMGLTQDDKQTMLDKAVAAMENAYVPYSHFTVGACLLSEDGRMFTGCNVENASYGLTNCAERTAVFKAVSEGCRAFTAIAIAGKGTEPWPCGACRQVLSEFCKDMPVYITWDGNTAEVMLSELLPHSFSPANGIQDYLGKDQAP